jgi:cytochrome c2
MVPAVYLVVGLPCSQMVRRGSCAAVVPPNSRQPPHPASFFTMRFTMRFAFSIGLVSLLCLLCTARPASAILQFYKVYKTEYLDNHPDKKYAAEVDKGTNKCYVCHQGKKRKNHNKFGQPLVEMLDRQKDMKNTQKISESIKKVVAMHVDPKDEKSETYLDRIKASKWPAGELKELMAEPKEEKQEVAQ